MTSHSRCAKESALVRHKILSSSRTSGVGGRVVEEFRSCCCFLGKLFSQFRSCVSTNFLLCFLYDFSQIH